MQRTPGLIHSLLAVAITTMVVLAGFGSGGNESAPPGEPITSSAATSRPPATKKPPATIAPDDASPTPSPAGKLNPTDSPDSTTAATAHNWGAPVVNDDFANLAGWSVYDNGSRVDFGLKRKANITVADGILTIKGEPDGHTGGMTAKFSQEYGRWETRMKATTSKPCWRPVLLLWPDIGSNDKPGEIDMAESDGSLKRVTFFLHYPVGEQTSGEVNVDQTQWHNYAVDWAPDHVTGFVDGKEFWSTSEPNQIPHTPFHETFQLDAQGGDELCDGSTTMQIDWHRVYRP